jgi:hypothetical protein
LGLPRGAIQTAGQGLIVSYFCAKVAVTTTGTYRVISWSGEFWDSMTTENVDFTTTIHTSPMANATAFQIIGQAGAVNLTHTVTGDTCTPVFDAGDQWVAANITAA